jgi:hypothetical protein
MNASGWRRTRGRQDYMSHRALWCIALAVIGALSLCALIAIPSRDRPRIHIASEEIDLGVIDGAPPDPNRPDRVQFEVSNRGSGVLRLTRVHAGCACLEPRLERVSLLPGQTGTLSVRLAVPVAVGEFREKVRLYSNDDKHPVKELLVKGYVHRACYVLPPAVSVAGLRPGETRAVELEVTGPDADASFTVRAVTAKNKEVVIGTIERILVSMAASRATWRVRLAVAARALDSWEDVITVSTSSREAPLLDVPLKVQELAPVCIQPAAAVLRGQMDGTILKATIQVSANKDAPIAIARIEKPDWLDVGAEPNDGSLPTRLFLSPNGRFGSMNSVVDARISLVLQKGGRKVEIPVLFLPTRTGSAPQDQSR